MTGGQVSKLLNWFKFESRREFATSRAVAAASRRLRCRVYGAMTCVQDVVQLVMDFIPMAPSPISDEIPFSWFSFVSDGAFSCCRTSSPCTREFIFASPGYAAGGLPFCRARKRRKAHVKESRRRPREELIINSRCLFDN